MIEHDREPVRGLPQALPAGERLLWQGSPRWQALAVRAFHVRKLAAYCAVLAIWRLAAGLHDGQPLAEVLAGARLLVPFALVALGIPVGLAWLYARSTVYTITSRRVVIRSGVALPMALNLPFRAIGAAALRAFPDGTADLPLALAGSDRIGFIYLWPNVRPWRLARPEPMLRAVPDGRRVAEILARALAAAAAPAAAAQAAGGQPADAAPEPVTRPLATAAA